MKIRKGDTVMVKVGKDQTKQGRVERVLQKQNRVVIEGINLITRHVKATQGVRQGGRIQQEAPIHVSDVMLICKSCNQPVRVGYRTLDNGSKVRVCHKCKETIS
jgi:large subunit ribosomal protein L24